jgi:hypothetical protein
MESFKSILHELERQTKELDSAFVCYYSDLEEDPLNDKEIEVRFSEAQPLFVFEHAAGFNPNNSYAYETNKKKVKHKIYVETKTQSGWVKSDHTGAGGISCKHTLKW